MTHRRRALGQHFSTNAALNAARERGGRSSEGYVLLVEEDLLSSGRISYVGRELICFDDDSWRFIQVEHYWLPRLSPKTEVTSAVQALRLLMANPRYQLNYQGEHPDGDPMLHGPYRFDHLSIDSYEPVDEQTAIETITAFRDDDEDNTNYGTLSNEVIADIDFRVLRQIRKTPIRYRLSPLPDEAIAGPRYEALGDYTELVLIHLAANELLLVSAAQD